MTHFCPHTYVYVYWIYRWYIYISAWLSGWHPSITFQHVYMSMSLQLHVTFQSVHVYCELCFCHVLSVVVTVSFFSHSCLLPWMIQTLFCVTKHATKTFRSWTCTMYTCVRACECGCSVHESALHQVVDCCQFGFQLLDGVLWDAGLEAYVHTCTHVHTCAHMYTHVHTCVYMWFGPSQHNWVIAPYVMYVHM